MPASDTESPRLFRFGVFELDVRAGELRKNGLKVKVQKQPLDILKLLLERPGEVITREELRNQLWPADTFVDFDHSLNAAIKRLRDVLGDLPDNPRFVETLPRHGYRFLASVSMSPGASGDGTRLALISSAQPAILRPISRWWKTMTLMLVVLLIALGIAKRFWRSETQVPEWPQKRLTANPNEDPVKTAVISPDGIYLAYADATGAYVKQIATGETHPLNLPNGFAGHPVAWYPDSNHLLVQSMTTAEERPSLWSDSITGGGPHTLAQDAWGASVSADGSRVAFIRNAVGVSGICRLNLDCRYALGREIWVMAANGTEPQKIVTANPEDRFGPVAWSHDGQRIAYVRLHGSWVSSDFLIEIRDLRTGEVVVVLADPRLNIATAQMLTWQPIVCWTPDGRIIFSFREAPPNQDDSNVWSVRIDPQTGRPIDKPARITSGPGSISAFSITTDGKRLAFIKNTLQPQIYVGEIDAQARVLKNFRRLTLDQRANLPFSWTPDNRAVIFSSHREGRYDLYKQYVGQSIAEVLVVDPATDKFVPRLSPDSSEILYLAYPLNGTASTSVRLMRVPTSGGPPHLVLESPSIDNQQCARVPATICVLSRGAETPQRAFYSFDPVTGAERKLIEFHDERFPHWSLSPNGLLLAVVAEDPREGLIRLFSLPDGTARDLLVQGWSGLSTVDWAADSKSLFISAIKPDGTTFLLNIDLRGRAQALIEQKNGTLCWAIPSSDGKYLATMQMEGESNAWMLENF
jgi:DNA-binding winged helix-turn-helix (wHTH) protein/Tol biopolymer transport system component